ncbi:type II and III secretion system protein family protein [Tuwongella immobilis]|uniref:Type II/III secretion system secretin-like domain-containing protein n=1 Tax=Tuwongella immobilis TaxID=692036 RepID=A0A6C2YX68_9BACT|nr:hypothetical protein [Tuwongella immobilis]VIP05405.1 bacterial type ii iii secretion system protein : Type II and III secretion system protein OS=Rhodopirellula europaea SH398 GN=RESH_04833 PE=4 SV=1: Secretin [Tuwongella immobilis]VTS08166.1 bacterial type ii iii secretion system protein : Type II and III secretion system protein OS=Rhodopirellula europaea SH398 GN=RESH_04833 PE=4 SV=1: Secretin [Tuwongella immobilis]
MHRLMHTLRRLAWGLAGLGGMVLTTQAYSQAPDAAAPAPRPAAMAKTDRTGAIIVPQQGSIRLQMKTQALIRDVFNERENVVTVLPDATNPAAVVIFGRQIGLSRITLTDTKGVSETYEVVVQPDIELLRKLLQQSVPTANVQVIPGLGNTVILTGNVAHTNDVDVITRVAGSVLGGGQGSIINAMTVGGVAQVQLDVTVAAVNRTEARRRGFAFGIQDGTSATYSILGGLGGPAPGPLTPGSDANLGTIFNLGTTSIQAFLQALKTEGLTKILAEPKLVTHSGRPARFLAGGRQAVPSQTSGFGGGSPGITYEDVGTELQFLPVVYGNGKIYLEVEPRIRQTSQAFGTSGPFGPAPGFSEQSVRTSVLLEPGQTFAIGGLIQTTTQSQATRVPLLGELPFVGTLFSQTTTDEQEQEVIVLVTPRLVDALDCGQLTKRLPGRETRSPSDYEFFLETLLETPRGPRSVFENRRYKAAWKNDPTAAYYPCGPNGNCGTADPLTGASNCANGTCAPAAMNYPTAVGAAPSIGGNPGAATVSVPNVAPPTATPVSLPNAYDPSLVPGSRTMDLPNLPNGN